MTSERVYVNFSLDISNTFVHTGGKKCNKIKNKSSRLAIHFVFESRCKNAVRLVQYVVAFQCYKRENSFEKKIPPSSTSSLRLLRPYILLLLLLQASTIIMQCLYTQKIISEYIYYYYYFLSIFSFRGFNGII